MAGPKYLQRIARLPEVMNLLAAYPGGLALRDLAARFGVEVETMRQDLLTFVELDSWGWSVDIFRLPALEFVHGDEGAPTAEEGDTLIRVVPDASPGLGADHLSAGDLAVLYTAGAALLDVDPDDTDLAEALTVIAQTMYGEGTSAASAGGPNPFLHELQTAQEQRRQVKIVYSRAWQQGVGERVIEPLRLVQTRRGWEVDAGPVGPEGNLRTFLLSNVRSADVLTETFEPPAGVEALLERQRRTTTVRMEISQDGRWAARQYAERVTVVEEDEEKLTVELELLPPVGERVALILLASGPETRIRQPGSVASEASAAVERLLKHHSG